MRAGALWNRPHSHQKKPWNEKAQRNLNLLQKSPNPSLPLFAAQSPRSIIRTLRLDCLMAMPAHKDSLILMITL